MTCLYVTLSLSLFNSIPILAHLERPLPLESSGTPSLILSRLLRPMFTILRFGYLRLIASLFPFSTFAFCPVAALSLNRIPYSINCPDFPGHPYDSSPFLVSGSEIVYSAPWFVYDTVGECGPQIRPPPHYK